MNVHHIFFCCYFSAALFVGSRSISVLSGAVGEDFSIACRIKNIPFTKFLCRNKCEDGNILIKTNEMVGQKGRYSTGSESGYMYMTIKNLIKSDSGGHRFGLGRSLVPDEYCDFELAVTDDLTKPKPTLSPSSSVPPTMQSLSFSSKSSTVSSAFTKIPNRHTESLGENSSGSSRTQTEGGEVTYGCENTVYGNRKFLCKNQCNTEDDILIDTSNEQAQSGRYSITYIKGSVFGLYVTVTQLTKSDTGLYRCGYGSPLSPDSFWSFQIVVIGASDSSASRPQTTAHRLHSGSGSSKPSPASPETTDQRTGYILLLTVCMSLGGFLLAFFMLLLFIWKRVRTFQMDTRRNAANTNMELFLTYANIHPSSTHEDSVYQSLSPVSRNQDQPYSALAKRDSK